MAMGRGWPEQSLEEKVEKDIYPGADAGGEWLGLVPTVSVGVGGGARTRYSNEFVSAAAQAPRSCS